MNIYKIAELSGYSIATVSRVINGAPNVRTKTRENILKVIEQTGFIPNLNARDLTSQKTKTLGMVLPGINSYFSDAVEVIGRKLSAEQGHVLISTNPSGVFNAAQEVESLKLLLSKRVQGVIFFVSRLTDQHMEVLQKWPESVSLVLINEAGGTLGFSSVIQNPRPGLEALFPHLWERGRRKLAFIDGPSEDRTAWDRIQERNRILEGMGFEVKEKWTREGTFGLWSGALEAKELLKNPGFDTLVCGNDFMAMGAIQALEEAGVSVPEDVAVTGYDNLEITEYTNPPLTTISQPPRELGEAALELTYQAWETPDSPPRSMVLDSKLVIRKTT